MNKEVVIIKSILIDRPKQVKVFDIKIPRQAKNIIGIEMGMRWHLGALPRPPLFDSLDGFFKMYRNILFGELKLQSYNEAKIFYSQELSQDQNFIHSHFTAKKFNPTPFTHQAHLLEDPIFLNGDATIIQGIYKDQLELLTPYSYTVNVYVWLENK
ncbi:MAG: hypothetical protein H0U95_15425 [Bacteroidetes bacterium]|nr:hypothetical protein [Bacteroidota bacterium]